MTDAHPSNSPIKICYVTTVSITLKSFILEFAKYAHEKENWDITFVCNFDEDFAKSLPSYIRYKPIPMQRGMNLDMFRVIRELRSFFELEQFDIVQYSTPNASFYASIAAKQAKVPVRLYCQWGMAYVGFSGIKRYLFKTVEKITCALSTWIEPDSISNLTFAHDEGLYPPNVGSVVWNGSACGVCLEKFDVFKKEQFKEQIFQKHDIPLNSFVFGFVGRITRDKGVNELFSSFRSVLDTHNDVYLLLVGPTEFDGTMDENLISWSRECKNIIYAGYTDSVEKYMAAMDCYVLPSYREGFGMAVVEAEAMGVPVVVSDIPGPIDAMEDGLTGIVVEKGNVSELTSAFNRLYEDRGFCEACGRAGVKMARSRFERGSLFKLIVEDRYRLTKEFSR